MYYTLEPVFNDKTMMINQMSHWDYSLTLGVKQADDMPEPIEYEVDTDIGGTYLPATFLSEPVFSKNFVQELIGCGVDNIQTYEVNIVNPETQQYIEGYQAVNIVGTLACATLDGRECEKSNKDQYEFNNLVIKSLTADDLTIVRLAQCTQIILLHENIVKELSSETCRDLYFKAVDRK